MPLPVAVRAGEHRHLPGGMHPDGGALVQAGLRAQGTRDLRGRETAGLDVGGETDAEIAALLAGLLLLLAEGAVIEALQRLVQRRLVVPAVIEQGDGRLVRELVLGDEVLPPQVQRIHRQLLRGEVDHPLHQVARLRPTGAAVRVHGRRVREHGRDVDMDRRRAVRARQQGAVEVGRNAGREQRQVRAHVGDGLDPEPEDAAVRGERHLSIAVVIAAVRVGEEAFAPVGSPLHRARESARGPGHHALLRVDEDLRTEAASHVRRDHSQLVLGQSEHERGHQQPVHVGVLGREPESDFAGAGVRARQRRPGLDRVRDQPVVAEALLDDPGSAGERLVGGGLVAELPAEADVVARVVVHRGSPGLDRLGSIGYDRQRLVFDLDQLRCVPGDVRRLGDHHRDGLAHVARAIHRQRVVRGNLHVRNQPAHRDRLHAGRDQVLARVHGQHALDLRRRGRVNPDDAGVRMRAAHEGRGGGAWDPQIVDEGALAGDQAGVLAALDARSEEFFHGSPRLRGLLHRLDDVVVAGAPAEIAFQSGPDLGLARAGIPRQDLAGGEDHPGRA